MSEIAIIGAGLCGLAAAHVLQDAGLHVTLYEREPRVGGRATTHEREGFLYDPGAQYVHGNHLASQALLQERFASTDLIAIQKPIWVFSAEQAIREGDPRQNAVPRWSYRSGLITLPLLMAAGLEVRTGCPITRLAYTPAGWQLFDRSGWPLPGADRLLITTPAPEARRLIAASQLPGESQAQILAHLHQVHYRPLISLAFAWRHPVLPPTPWYALVNIDKAHPISWLAREEEKAPERVPGAGTLLIVQMAPDYSRQHWETPDPQLGRAVLLLASTLLATSLPEPDFSDVTRWPYALPATTADAEALNQLTRPLGLIFAGDAFAGGRAHLALEQGLQAARRALT